MLRRTNDNDGPYNSNTSPALLRSVSDKLTRIRFLDQSPAQQQAARERLVRAARPGTDAARLLRRGLYADAQPGELERLRAELGGLV
ncbi:MAG TPA: hypothetical protein VFT99_03930 [Roseiflexaceae bacterium]|nr:hypothetical protein [Roseiflexaceae bacterium]